MNQAQTAMAAQMAAMERNNVLQNILRIPLIEIEQLNPRIRQLHGAMGVRYHQVGGGDGDLDGTVNYEYDWEGQAVTFASNPLPRVPVGTGKVAYIADDSQDPAGEGIPVPKGALSGELFGWNREMLASHYGECYWKIIDPKIDAEIRDRYRSILINKYMAGGLEEKDAEQRADDLVAQAVEQQAKGAVGAMKVVVSRSSVSQGIKSGEKPKRHVSSADREEIEKMRRENEELRTLLAMKGDGSEEEPATNPKKTTGNKKSDTQGNLGAG